MKRLLTILLLLCLLMGNDMGALAEVVVTGQPETQTVKAGKSVTFSVEAEGVGRSTAVTWHFISPDGQEDVTGKKLSSRFKGLKVKKPNSQNIELSNIPEEMHGWSVYCHLGKPSSGVDTEKALLLIEGKESPAAEEGTGTTDRTGKDGSSEDGGDGAEADASLDTWDDTEEADASEEAWDDTEEDEAPEDAGDEMEAERAEAARDEAEEDETAADEEADADEEAADREAAGTLAENGSAGGTVQGSAAENAQIRGFSEQTEDYQYMQLGTYYYTENGGKKPLVWRVLYRKDNIAQLITENVIDAMQMIRIDDFYTAVKKRNYKSKYNTPYNEMDIYNWLNGEMAEVIFEEQDFSSAVVPHRIKEAQRKEKDIPEEPGYQTPESDAPLTAEEKAKFPYGKDLFYIMTYADMKNGKFGFPDTTFGNTKENEDEKAIPESGRRKAYATPYAKNKVQHPEWKKETKQYKLDVVSVYKGMNYGGSSPYWTIKRRKGYYMSGIVGANGHLSWSNMASVRIGVRPAAIVDLNKLRVTGGNGTLENPWIMELNE